MVRKGESKKRGRKVGRSATLDIFEHFIVFQIGSIKMRKEWEKML